MTTIRRRLLVILLAGLIVVVAAGGSAVYWMAEADFLSQLDGGLRARAEALASLVSYGDKGLEFEFDGGPAEAIGDGYFEFRTRAGAVLRRSGNLADASLPLRDMRDNELAFGDVALPGVTDARAVWLAFRPRVDDEDRPVLAAAGIDPETLVVAAAVDRRPTDHALRSLLATLIVVGGVVAATVGLLVSIGVRWGLVPLDRLSRELASVDGNTISRRFDDAGVPGELEPIYRELNRMLDRVQQTLERERSFADAAAHELRTPLAELRSTAEVAIRWPDAKRAMASLREVLSIGREMERLVECLLMISRGNASAAAGALDEVPVASIVHGCLERAGALISQKRLKLKVHLDERRALRAPPDAVEIIVRNLIDNAVQYTPSGGSISVRSDGAADRSPWLIVENEPVQLKESDLPRLFEPFWRAEGSRSDREHAGLGLAVVHQVADAIGLRVDAGLTGDRLQIRVSTPA